MIRSKPVLLKMLLATVVLFTAAKAPLWAEIRTEDVRNAIAQAVRFLKQSQSARGTWTEHPSYPGGVTALCALALLEAGVPPEDPSIQQALRILREYQNRRLTRTYSVSLATMVYCRAGNPADRPLIRKNVKWLERRQIDKGKNKGGWGYDRGQGDPSNTQFAVLALYEATMAGI